MWLLIVTKLYYLRDCDLKIRELRNFIIYFVKYLTTEENDSSRVVPDKSSPKQSLENTATPLKRPSSLANFLSGNYFTVKLV